MTLSIIDNLDATPLSLLSLSKKSKKGNVQIPKFLEQQFYLKEGKDKNRVYLTNPNAFLPQASLTEGNKINFEDNHYKFEKVRIEKDDDGIEKAALIILAEL